MALFGIKFDRHTLGNLVKNLSPAAGLLGGPLGIAAAGGLSALGDLGRGKNIGESLKGGVKNAALGAGLNAGVGAAKGLLGGGASSASSAVPGALPNSNIAGNASGMIPGGSFDTAGGVVDKALGVGGKVLGFAEKHPNATAGALSALGNLSTSGAQNRAANAQADLLEQQAGETAYDFDRRKRRDEQLAPLWSSLGTTIGSNYNSAAPNPYLPTGG